MIDVKIRNLYRDSPVQYSNTFYLNVTEYTQSGNCTDNKMHLNNFYVILLSVAVEYRFCYCIVRIFSITLKLSYFLYFASILSQSNFHPFNEIVLKMLFNIKRIRIQFVQNEVRTIANSVIIQTT